MKSMLHLFSFILLVACSAKNPTSDGPAKTSADTITQTAAADSIPFPVYMTFAEFQPYLQFSNDTTYVLNFWATWCKPCIAEMPYFEKLIREYGNQPVKTILVSMDFPKDIQRKLIPFVQERNITTSVVALADMDYNAWIDKVSTAWDGAIPFTLVYNKKGRSFKLGEMSGYEELEGMVKRAMK